MGEMQEVKLSIIIPHYNSVISLCHLLQSVGRNRYVEVIVVDDKSTEEWRYIIDEFPYVHFFENQSEMKGPGTARNIGLNKASGTWIMFADADDVYLDKWYGVVSSCFDYEQDIVFFPPDSFDEETGERNTLRGKWYQGLCRKYLDTGNDELLRSKFSPPWSKMIRRSLIEEKHIRFDEIMHWEDSMFSAKTGFFAKSVTVNQSPVYCINDHAGSMTRTCTKTAFMIRAQVIGEQYCFWKGKEGFENTLRILRGDGLRLISDASACGWRVMVILFRRMHKMGVPISNNRFLRLLLKYMLKRN